MVCFLTTYYFSDKNDEVGGVCGTCVEKRNACRFLVEKAGGNRPSGRT